MNVCTQGPLRLEPVETKELLLPFLYRLSSLVMPLFRQQGSSHCRGRDFVGVCFALQPVRVALFAFFPPPTVFESK